MSSSSLTSIRQDYKDQTRARILDAAVALVREAGEEPVTIAAVAARAGVTDRTVYRHFATREALIESLWKHMQDRVGSSEPFPRTAEELIAAPRRQFRRFDQSRELVRASVHSSAGIEVRLRSNADRRQALLDCVRDALPGLDEAALRRRAAIAQLIYSADAWDVLGRFWGLDGAEAGEAAAEALEILLGRLPAGE